jgi:hypothetical protein
VFLREKPGLKICSPDNRGRSKSISLSNGEGLFSAPFLLGVSAGEIHVNDFDLEPPTARPRAASVFDSFGLFDLTPDLAIRKFLGVDVEIPLSRLEIGELLVAYVGGPFRMAAEISTTGSALAPGAAGP